MGCSLRSKPDLEKVTSAKIGEGLSYAESTMCGIGVSTSGWRETNEDSHICLSPFHESKNSLFGVFDGHKGSEVSKYVQRHFAEELSKNKNYKDGKYEEALRETFMLMDVLLTSSEGREELFGFYKQSKEKQKYRGYSEKKQLQLEKAPKGWQSDAGCTANVVLITPENIFCANSGDSRAVACVSGECFELSHDHKPTDPEERKRIKKTQWKVYNGRVDGILDLSRAFGDLTYKKSPLPQEEQAVSANPDIIKLKNDKIDFILMGCDGIWENKSPKEMVEWISEKLQEQTKKETILSQLFEGQTAKDSNGLLGHDNMSAILIEFDHK